MYFKVHFFYQLEIVNNKKMPTGLMKRKNQFL